MARASPWEGVTIPNVMSPRTLIPAALAALGLSFASCSGEDTHVRARELCDDYLAMVRTIDADTGVPEAVVDRAYGMISSEDRAFLDASFEAYAKRDERAWREYLSDNKHGAVEAVWFRSALERGIVDAEAFRDNALEIMLRYDYAVYNNSPVYGQSRRLEPTVTEVTYGVPAALGADELIGRPFNVAEEADGELRISYLKNIERYNYSLRRNERDRRAEAAAENGTATAFSYVDDATTMLVKA